MAGLCPFARPRIFCRKLGSNCRMNLLPSQISPIDLGERLRIAREAVRVKQADAADIIGVVRTTLVAIEQGQRRIKMDELQKLAKAYNVSVNALLRQEAVYVDLAPRFR